MSNVASQRTRNIWSNDECTHTFIFKPINKVIREISKSNAIFTVKLLSIPFVWPLSIRFICRTKRLPVEFWNRWWCHAFWTHSVRLNISFHFILMELRGEKRAQKVRNRTIYANKIERLHIEFFFCSYCRPRMNEKKFQAKHKKRERERETVTSERFFFIK